MKLMKAVKITKREFVEAMTGNTTIFCGLTNCFDPQKIGTAIDDWKLEVVKKHEPLYKRTAYARSRDVVFSDGSHLPINGMHFYKLETERCVAYMARHYIKDDVWGTYDKSMIYVIAWESDDLIMANRD